MYILKQLNGPGIIYLYEDKEHIVSRKRGDIVLQNDQSVSRHHATLKKSGASLSLNDCNSKYGTCHNNTKLIGNDVVILNSNDTIKFGVFLHEYRLDMLNIVVTSSGLNNLRKIALQVKIGKLGGTFLEEWSNDCTHLTVDVITLTVKVLLALIDEKPIVTMRFWVSWFKSITEGLPLPKCEDFKPEIAETLVNLASLEYKEERRVLFKEKVFVFPSKKLTKRMGQLITKCGGSSITWGDKELSPLEVTSARNKYIFITCDDAKNYPPSLKEIHEDIIKFDQRPIPLQEIALSVIRCSIEKDCNPNFKRLAVVFASSSQTNDCVSQVFPLAPESQQRDIKEEVREDLIIFPSLETPRDDVTPGPSGVKRSASSQDLQGVASKKSKTEGASEEDRDKVADSNVSDSGLGGMGECPNRELENSSSENSEGDHSSVNVNPFLAPKAAKRTQVENPFSLKRKRAVESQDEENDIQNSAILNARINPFLVPTTSKRIIIDNPFAQKNPKNNSQLQVNPFALHVKTESITPEKDVVARTSMSECSRSENDAIINPFLAPKKAKRSVLTLDKTSKAVTKDSSMVQSIKLEVTSPDARRIDVSSMFSSLDAKWLCKSQIVKKESVLEPEMKEYFERFKNSVIIEKISPVIKSLDRFEQDRNRIDSSGAKNVKMFRKVLPLRPQTKIISTTISTSAKGSAECIRVL